MAEPVRCQTAVCLVEFANFARLHNRGHSCCLQLQAHCVAVSTGKLQYVTFVKVISFVMYKIVYNIRPISFNDHF